MLVKAEDFAAIVAGRVDTAFRRWVRPTVKTGGTLTTAAGVLAIDAVDVVALDGVTDEDLKRAGFASREELDALLGNRKGSLHRIRLHYVGADPRHGLRDSADLGDTDKRELADKIARMDGSAPWVRRTLELIVERPGEPAQALAELVGVEKLKFKNNVRRLKALGLTESLAVGYRISPRGQAWLQSAIASA